MRKVDGWRSLNERPSDQTIDLAAWSGNLVTLEIAPKSIPTPIATAPAQLSDVSEPNWLTLARRISGDNSRSLLWIWSGIRKHDKSRSAS